MPALPQPHQLAALGAVLCLFRPRTGGELGGWVRAVRAAWRSTIDNEGVRESLLFFDAGDRLCWQLHLLPDTDFLAWERLWRRLPQHRGEEGGDGIAERLWRRFAERRSWELDAIRLHALPPSPGFSSLRALAASPVPLSQVGADAARRIARSEGVEAGRLIDDCRCRAATPAAGHAGEVPYPLIGFGRSGTA